MYYIAYIYIYIQAIHIYIYTYTIESFHYIIPLKKSFHSRVTILCYILPQLFYVWSLPLKMPRAVLRTESHSRARGCAWNGCCSQAKPCSEARCKAVQRGCHGPQMALKWRFYSEKCEKDDGLTCFNMFNMVWSIKRWGLHWLFLGKFYVQPSDEWRNDCPEFANRDRWHMQLDILQKHMAELWWFSRLQAVTLW